MSKYTSPYTKDDPRYVMSIDESEAAMKNLTSTDIKSFYTNFYGASNSYVTVVGDFDSTKVHSIINSEFGSWKSPQPFSRLVDKDRNYKPINKNIETPDKANAIFVASQTVKLSMKDADYPAMLMANYMIGGGF